MQLDALQKKLNYVFNTPSLLEQALRTPAAASSKILSYERLEFLGDRVIGLVIAKLLYDIFTQERQGDLSKRFVAMVRQETLVDIAAQLDLRAHIKSAGKVADKDITPSVISDVLEAVVAAIYLDGGYAAAESAVVRLWNPMLSRDSAPPRDAKTELQEWAQARGLELPQYKMTEIRGEAHKPEFTIEVSLHNFPKKTGSGANKRQAEQQAAGNLLQFLEGSHGS